MMVNPEDRAIVSFSVPPELDGTMVKDLIRNRFGISRALLRKIVGLQGVLVNGQPVFITSRVRAGDCLQLVQPAEVSEDIFPEPIPFAVVYEDADLLVVDKPAGLVVHPTKGHYTGTLANGVVYYWQSKGEAARFRPVHRLDKDTSGLLVISKNHYSHQVLSDQLAKRNFLREYLAVVHGVIADDHMTIDAPIMKKPDDPRERIIAVGGQRAVTHVRVERRFTAASLVRLRLETGRTHQIRVHMKHIGHPLFGDDLYGTGNFDGMERQALHAETLGLVHPRSGKWLCWKSELPQDIRNLLRKMNSESLL
jgi:23S rRNA pseudouridine1911/1915/1917 synthase